MTRFVKRYLERRALHPSYFAIGLERDRVFRRKAESWWIRSPSGTHSITMKTPSLSATTIVLTAALENIEQDLGGTHNITFVNVW